MNHEQFWKIIADACQSDPASAEEWADRLTEELSRLPADEIVAWDYIFEELYARADRILLWAAAYLINGGASDDGFCYFRCWLIGMGRDIYNNAINDPDSLSTVASRDWDAEGIDAQAEIYDAAHQAWLAVTGYPDTADYPPEYPARDESTKLGGDDGDLGGDDWDFDDHAEMQRRLPKLTALYSE